MVNKVLLADDSATIQKLVEMALSDSEFELLAVSDGKQAVDKLADFRPDIVLADAIMPALNGYEVCAHVKGNPATAHIPVILLAGRFQPYDKEQAEAAGVDDKIVKPFSQDQLVTIMTQAIEAARADAPAPETSEVPLEPIDAVGEEPPLFDEGATIQASPEQLRASLSMGETDDLPEIDAFSLEEGDDEPMTLHTADLEEVEDVELEPVGSDDDSLELTDEDIIEPEAVDLPEQGNFEETLSLSPQPFGTGEDAPAGDLDGGDDAEPEIEEVEVEELELADEDLGDDDLEETLVVPDEDTQPSLGEDTEPNLDAAAASLALGEPIDPVEPELSEPDRGDDELVFSDEDETGDSLEIEGEEEPVLPVVNEADTVELDEREMEEIREAAQNAELTGEDFDLELNEDDALGDEDEPSLEVEEIDEPLLGDVVETLDTEPEQAVVDASAGEIDEPEPLSETPDFELLGDPAEPDVLEDEAVLEDIGEESETAAVLEDESDEPLVDIEDPDSFTEESASEPDTVDLEPAVESPAVSSFADTVQQVVGPISLSDEQMDALARRVASHLVGTVGTDFMRDVIWQVVPELAEAMIKKRIYQLEQSVDES